MTSRSRPQEPAPDASRTEWRRYCAACMTYRPPEPEPEPLVWWREPDAFVPLFLALCGLCGCVATVAMMVWG